MKRLKSSYLSVKAFPANGREMWKRLRLIGRYSKRDADGFAMNCSLLNDFFASNFQHEESISHHLPPSEAEYSEAPSATVSEVSSMLSRLKRKSCGPDGVQFWVLRDFAPILASAITTLFNRSLRTCIVPSMFKLANISPIPKCPRPSEVSDYRPISLLPVLAKLLEKIVLRKCILPRIRLQLDPMQFAYQPTPGSGTTTALTLLYHRIVSFLDSSSGAVRVMTIDFKKAFEKLTHSTILRAAASFDLPPFTISWIASFLSGRYQRVATSHEMSPWVPVTSGVPQGSVLGPILFCLALNSLQPCRENTSIIKYADDVTFLHSIRDSDDDQLQAEWDNLVGWSEVNKLPLNPTKCQVMNIITKKSITLKPIICAERSSLSQASELRLLGVTLSSDMKWDSHFDNCLKRARKRIFVLSNLRRSGCCPVLMYRTYCALMRSVLSYAYPAFCNAPRRLWKKFVQFERRCFRIIGQNDFLSLEEACESSARRLFKEIDANEQHPLRELFCTRPANRTRRTATLFPPQTKTKRLSASFIRFSS